MFMGYSWRTRSGVLAWKLDGQQPLSHSTLPIHFRHSSLILKTMMAMSSARRIVVRSVTVIYTKMFASTWCNADCLFEEQNLNFNRIICHQSSQRCADISLTQHAWSIELVLWYIFFYSYECKACFNVSATSSNSCWEAVALKRARWWRFHIIMEGGWILQLQHLFSLTIE